MDKSKSQSLRILFTFSWGLLCIIAPMALILTGDYPNFNIVVLYVWLIIAYSSWRITMLAIKGEKRLISITFWIFVYVFFGIAPLLQVAADSFPGPGHYTDEMIVKTIFLILSGLIAYDIGSIINKPILLRKFVLKPFLVKRIITWKAIILFSLLVLLLFPFLLRQVGGVEFLFMPRHERFLMLRNLTGGQSQAIFQVLSAIIRIPTFVAFLMLSVFLLFKREKKLVVNWREKILLITLFITTLIVNNPVGSTRFWFGTIILSSIFVYLPQRPHYFGGLVFGLIILLIFVFPFSDLFRFSFDVSLPQRISSTTVENELIGKGDYDAFQQLLNTKTYVQYNDFTYGKQLLGTLLFWFPRSLWAGKPIPTGQLVANYSGYSYTNLSLPLWGELYIDGGIVSVFVLFCFYGILISMIEDYYVRSEKNYPIYLNAFVPLYAAYQLFLLRGSLMSTFAYLVPVLLCMYICTSKQNVSAR